MLRAARQEPVLFLPPPAGLSFSLSFFLSTNQREFLIKPQQTCRRAGEGEGHQGWGKADHTHGRQCACKRTSASGTPHPTNPETCGPDFQPTPCMCVCWPDGWQLCRVTSPPAPELFESTSTSAGPAGPLLSEAGKTPWAPLMTHSALCSEGLSSVSLWPPPDVGFPSAQRGHPSSVLPLCACCAITPSLWVFSSDNSPKSGECLHQRGGRLPTFLGYPPLTLHIKSGLKGMDGTVTLPARKRGCNLWHLALTLSWEQPLGWHPGERPGAQLLQAGLCVCASASQNP